LRQSVLTGANNNNSTASSVKSDLLRPLTMDDIKKTLNGFQPTSHLSSSSGSGSRFGSTSSVNNNNINNNGHSASPSSSSPDTKKGSGFGMSNHQFDEGFGPENDEALDDDEDDEEEL